MRKIIDEGDDPFAERPPIKKRLVKGLAITIVALVVIAGGLIWFRFQPAFTQESQAAITVNQPAWGTAHALVAPAATNETTPADDAGSDKSRGKPKAQVATGRGKASKEPPPQVARTPTSN
ncbi:MAG: hypothetical protein JNL04_19035 [Rhodospirillaceae bacterium]|nr:hypothetical protein [Rhodospirillaceae bacterium]